MRGRCLAAAALLAAAACSHDQRVFDAEVGECIEEPEGGERIESFDDVDCTDDHFGEIFRLVDHEGDDYPGLQELREEAAEECEGDGFEDYFGAPYDETAILVAYLPPSEESWQAGERETICIGHLDRQEVSGSLEGAGDEYPLGDAEVPGG